MENKNSKGLVVAVVILSVLVVVLGAYIGYDKFLNKEEIIKNENKEKIVTVLRVKQQKQMEMKKKQTKVKKQGKQQIVKQQLNVMELTMKMAI